MQPRRHQHHLRGRPVRLALLAVISGGLLGVAVLFAEATIARRQPRTPDPDFEVRGHVVEPAGDAGADADAREVTIAVIGDSLVRGVGVEQADDSLPVQVAQRVADATGRRVRVSSWGVTGEETAEIARRLREIPGRAEAPDVLVIVAGSNDVTGMTPPGTLARQTDDMLDEATKRFPRAQVVLAGIPRFEGTPALKEPLQSVVDRYSRVLQDRQERAASGHRRLRYVDIARRASPRFEGRPESYSSDGYHPSKVGYGFWADAIAEDAAQAAEDAAARASAASAAAMAGRISRS